MIPDELLMLSIGSMHASMRLWSASAKLRAAGSELAYREKVLDRITEQISEKHSAIITAAETCDGHKTDYCMQRMLEYFIEDMGTHLQAIDLERIPTSNEDTDDAFTRGLESFPNEQCPYEPGTKAFAAWQSGRSAK